MKTQIIRTVFIFMISFIFLNVDVYAQVPDPPGQHGQNGNTGPGEGAPIGSGLIILLSLGAGYGAKKFYDYKKKKLLD